MEQCREASGMKRKLSIRSIQKMVATFAQLVETDMCQVLELQH